MAKPTIPVFVVEYDSGQFALYQLNAKTVTEKVIRVDSQELIYSNFDTRKTFPEVVKKGDINQHEDGKLTAYYLDKKAAIDAAKLLLLLKAKELQYIAERCLTAMSNLTEL